MNGPLTGVRVLDLSQVVAGPLATMMMAEQGADVIKVEGPTGEMTRLQGPDDVNALIANNNRGKRSVVVDLAADGAADVILRLASGCDVVVENYRPGVADRLGVGYDAIREIAPDIIYCSITGFGEDGPYADRVALDPVIQAYSGMVHGQASMALPFPDLIRTLVADKSTAYTAAQAVTAALFARTNGAGGQRLDIAMLDATMAFFWPDGMSDKTYDDPARDPMRVVDLYRLVDTADGQIVYFISTQGQLEGMWRILGLDHFLDDPDLGDITRLGADPEKAISASATADAAIGSKTTAEMVALCDEHSIPCGPVLDRDAALADPQLDNNGVIVSWEHPIGGPLRQARPATHFAATPSPLRPEVAVAGEHTDEVLAEAGYDEDEIASLHARGITARIG